VSLLLLVYRLFQIFKEKITLTWTLCDLFFLFKILKIFNIFKDKWYAWISIEYQSKHRTYKFSIFSNTHVRQRDVANLFSAWKFINVASRLVVAFRKLCIFSCIFSVIWRNNMATVQKNILFIYQLVSITKESIELSLCNLVRYYVIK